MTNLIHSLWLLEEASTTGSTTTTTTSYSAGGKRVALAVNGTLSYLGIDGQGSATVALDGTGNVQASVLYGPYGAVRYSSGTMPGSYGYTGQHADATTGLDYYNARYYDASAGQFASADTAQDGLNRYGYVHGNPTTNTDPSGHRICPNTAGGGCTCTQDCGGDPPPCTQNCGGDGGGNGGGGGGNPHPCGGSWTPKQCQEARSARLAAASGWLAAMHFGEALLAGVNLFIDFKQFQADRISDPLKALGDGIAVVGDFLAIFSAALSALAVWGADVLSIQKGVDALAGVVNFLAGLYKTFVASTGFWLGALRILILAGIDAAQVVFGESELTLSLVFVIAAGALKKLNPEWDLDLVKDAARAFGQSIISGAYATYEFIKDESDGQWCNDHQSDCPK